MGPVGMWECDVVVFASKTGAWNPLVGVFRTLAAYPCPRGDTSNGDLTRLASARITPRGVSYTGVFRKLAAEGAVGFYTGPVAEAVVAAVRGQGGLLTAADLAAHTSVFADPICATYGSGPRAIANEPDRHRPVDLVPSSTPFGLARVRPKSENRIQGL
eukprot:1190799-Prorocentrum_minimum.AAC.1